MLKKNKQTQHALTLAAHKVRDDVWSFVGVDRIFFVEVCVTEHTGIEVKIYRAVGSGRRYGVLSRLGATVCVIAVKTHTHTHRKSFNLNKAKRKIKQQNQDSLTMIQCLKYSYIGNYWVP